MIRKFPLTAFFGLLAASGASIPGGGGEDPREPPEPTPEDAERLRRAEEKRARKKAKRLGVKSEPLSESEEAHLTIASVCAKSISEGQ